MGRVWPRHGHHGRPLNSVVRSHRNDTVETPTWLFPAVGTLCALYAIGAFVVRMPSRSAAIAVAALILVIAAWNVWSPSIWSVASAMLILIWMLYTMKSDEFRELGISSGKPLPKYAKWLFILIVVEVVVGIGHSYYKYVQ